MKTIDNFDVNVLFDENKTDEMRNFGLGITGGKLYDTRYSFERCVRKGIFEGERRKEKQEELKRQFYKFRKLLFKGGNRIIRHLNVRHPFARLESAYRDKMDPATTTSTIRYQKQYRDFMNETGFKLFKKGNAWIPTFEDFLEAVSFYPEDMYNKHWSPMWTICEPCLIDYDVITKTETMDEDFKYLQKKWNEKLKVPAFHAYSDTKMDYNNYEENLLKIYKNVSRKVIEKLVEVYEWDFKLFGYDPKPFLRNKN